ncbi:MAG: hypothetical protein K8R18_11745 [Parvibaculum sp.]|uniref:hypothetical protein n=1 Tax=Parvibaculum sp. TaxID=2024848 RepID=UPI0025DF51E9|nr:hypothetical protein [Parvibaculum sp.]MCE9650284.1 hypothetical protein [Parvibaculum sp.]
MTFNGKIAGAFAALLALAVFAVPAAAAQKMQGMGQHGPGWGQPQARFVEVRFALTFEGVATPADKSGRNLSVRAEARAPRDLDKAVTRGKSAVRFDSTVANAADGSFMEKGRIAFGGGELRFESDQRGRLGPSAAPSLQQGYAVWRVVDGTGVFRGASGYIVSNFTVGPKGAVKDSEVAVLLLRR